jgi:excisionase family DNA binding protein
MLTAEKVIKEIYQLPLKEREKIASHIILFGIKIPRENVPEPLNLEDWQNELSSKPFSLTEASEYLGISSVTLRRWVKQGRLLAYKLGRAYTFEVEELKKFKKSHRV